MIKINKLNERINDMYINGEEDKDKTGKKTLSVSLINARQVSLNIHPDRPGNDWCFTNLIRLWGLFIYHDTTFFLESEEECWVMDSPAAVSLS